MFTKPTTTALIATVMLTGTAAFGQSIGAASMSTSASFDGPRDSVSSSSPSVSDAAEGPGIQLATPGNNSPRARNEPVDEGIVARRMADCDEAGGRYVVGPVCFDNEGNAIQM